MEGPIRVYLADDNVEFCELFRSFVRGQKEIELVGVANTGNQALQGIHSRLVDLLLLDIIMPDLDGLGVLEQMGANPPDPSPKVIVFSAFGEEQVARRAMELGADYYIVKPFPLDTLLERIRQVHRGLCQGRQIQHYLHGNRKEREVVEILNQLGVPARLKGYRYLEEAIGQVVENIQLLGRVTKGLYPQVGARFRTTPQQVERSIRHAIELTWRRGNQLAIIQYFGVGPGVPPKPSNSTFIAKISEAVRINLGNG